MEQIQIPGLDHLKVSGDLHMLGVYPKVLGRIYTIGSLSGLVKEGKKSMSIFYVSMSGWFSWNGGGFVWFRGICHCRDNIFTELFTNQKAASARRPRIRSRMSSWKKR